MSRAAFLIATLVVVGCRSVTPPAVLLGAEDPRPRALLDALERRADEHQAMRGLARISLDAQDLRFRGSQRIAARRPARLRVEVLGLFSQIAAVLVTDGQTYQFFDTSSREVETGPMYAGLLWELARIDLAPDEAVDLLLGAPALPEERSLVRSEGMHDGSIRLHLEDRFGRPREVLEFDELGRLRRMDRAEIPGDPGLSVLFDDYRDLAGISFPFETELRFPRFDAVATLQFQNLELDPELPDEIFVIDLPERVSSAPGGKRG